MQRNTWPGLALAGGVLVVAIVALLVLGNGNGRRPADTGPAVTPPGSTRIVPGPTDAPGETGRPAQHRHARLPVVVTIAPGGSAAASQYGAGGNRGTVLGGP